MVNASGGFTLLIAHCAALFNQPMPPITSPMAFNVLHERLSLWMLPGVFLIAPGSFARHARRCCRDAGTSC